VVICENDVEASNRFHEEILANAEGVMKALELPYRVVNVCTGDLGRGQAKKYDIEAWMPSRGNYCETHSASKFYDFQARRMNLRYKSPDAKKNIFCHTLNNTVIASPRVLIPLMELYQNADGSILRARGASPLHERQGTNRTLSLTDPTALPPPARALPPDALRRSTANAARTTAGNCDHRLSAC